MRLAVPDSLAGERADKVVAVLADVSRAVGREMCDQRRVLVGDRPVGARERLSAGDVVTFTMPEPEPALRPEPIDLVVPFEDDHLLVVDKPAGMVVHPGAGRRDGTLAAALLHRHPEIRGVGEEGRWGIVHRLDRGTSGLLVVALTAEAHRELRGMLERREIHRRYLALAAGTFETRRGSIEAPIGRDPFHPTRFRATPDGRPARTHYRVLAAADSVTLLEVVLDTGRTHQIRVHLASIDHPLVGDPVYGRPGPVSSPRVFLHAAGLQFAHPVTGEHVDVESPLPPDLAAVLDAIGLHAP